MLPRMVVAWLLCVMDSGFPPERSLRDYLHIANNRDLNNELVFACSDWVGADAGIPLSRSSPSRWVRWPRPAVTTGEVVLEWTLGPSCCWATDKRRPSRLGVLLRPAGGQGPDGLVTLAP